MKSKHWYGLALLLLMLLVLALRLVVSYQVAEPGYKSYFTLLQAEQIREHGVPRYSDPNSYEGRRYAFDPAYYYLVAFFTLFLPATLVLKVLPNLLLTLLIPIVYLIGHALTKNRGVSLFAALCVAFIPSLFTLGINEATPLTLALPLFAATLLAILSLEQHPTVAMLSTALLTLVSPLVWILLIAEVLYFFILSAERLKITTSYLELAFVTFLMSAWYTLITYKEALFRYGIAILGKSLPATVRAATFQQFTLLTMLYAVGIVPLALGSLALYRLFEQRNRNVLFIATIGLVVLLLGVLHLLPLNLTLLLLSLLFTLLAAPGLHSLLLSFRRTKFSWAAHPTLFLLLILFLLTSFLPSLVSGLYPGSSPTPNELAAMDWLAQQPRGVVLAVPKEGFLINERAHQPYVADEAYLLIQNPDEVLTDIDEAYTTPRTVGAVALMEKYRVKWILIGPSENARYPEFGAILKDKSCFPVVYRNPLVTILQVNCTLTGGKT